MITAYDPNTYSGTHTVRITFMRYEYIGHIAFEIGGNCKGSNIISSGIDLLEYFDPEIDRLVENDCQFTYNEDEDMFSLTLVSPTGDYLCGDFDLDDINNSIVAIEIVNYKEWSNETNL